MENGESIVIRYISENVWMLNYFIDVYPINNLNKISFEVDDLRQEYYIVMYSSIKSYLKLKAEGQQPECTMRTWIFHSILKRVSFIKRKFYFEKNRINTIPIEDFDHGEIKNYEYNEDGFVIDGEDILNIIEDESEREICRLKIYGYKHKEISGIYGIDERKVSYVWSKFVKKASVHYGYGSIVHNRKSLELEKS